MNWLLVAVALLLIGFAAKGGHVGFIKTVFSISALVVSLVLSVSLSPYVSKEMQNNKWIKDYMMERIEKVINLEEKNTKVTDEVEIIEGLNLPKALKNALRENNNTEVYKTLAIRSFKEYISSYLTVVIINSISFFIVFVIINVVLFILASALDILSKLPVLNGLNKTAGILVGLLQGLIVVWILCIVLTMFSTEKIGQNLFSLINQSKFLSNIYNNNMLLKATTDIAKAFF